MIRINTEILYYLVINDNNNFAPSFSWSLCEFVGVSFGPRYFSSGATLPQKKYLGPKQTPPQSDRRLTA